VLDVWVEGALAIDNLDILQAAGGASTAYVVPVQTTVSDGFVTIEFVPVVENPMITAIEIVPLSAPTPVASPVAPPVTSPVTPPVATPPSAPTFQDILINCGGTSFGGSNVLLRSCCSLQLTNFSRTILQVTLT
jgi:Malectin domain